MTSKHTPLADELDSILVGTHYSEAVLLATAGQMQRLAHHLEGAPEPHTSKEFPLPFLVASACRDAGIFTDPNSESTSMQGQRLVLLKGAKAARDWAGGDYSSQVRFALADAALILRACEKGDLLLAAHQHLSAHRACVNGEWDHPALTTVGAMHGTAAQRAAQIDDHYLNDNSKEQEAMNLPILSKPETADIEKQAQSLRERILGMGLSNDPTLHYDVYVDMGSEGDCETGKTFLNKEILLRMVDFIEAAEKLEVSEISDMHGIVWPKNSHVSTDLDRIEIGRSFSSNLNLGRFSIQFHGTESGGSMRYSSDVLDFEQLLARTEEMLRGQRDGLVFSDLPDPEGENLQDAINIFERRAANRHQP